MSRVRTRVDRRDWWASRMVVSVMSSFFWASTQSRTASGPFSSSSCLSPVHLGGVCWKAGKRGALYWLRSALGFFTWISAM